MSHCYFNLHVPALYFSMPHNLRRWHWNTDKTSIITKHILMLLMCTESMAITRRAFSWLLTPQTPSSFPYIQLMNARLRAEWFHEGMLANQLHEKTIQNGVGFLCFLVTFEESCWNASHLWNELQDLFFPTWKRQDNKQQVLEGLCLFKI